MAYANSTAYHLQNYRRNSVVVNQRRDDQMQVYIIVME